MDKLSKKARSENMSRIRGSDTMPEKTARKFLFSKGLRFRKNDKRYSGKPDIVLPKYKTIVFINGCFWHCHENCKDFTLPKSNTDFWRAKLNNNVQRDKVNYSKLRDDGWHIIVVWECELKEAMLDKRLELLYQEITSSLPHK